MPQKGMSSISFSRSRSVSSNLSSPSFSTARRSFTVSLMAQTLEQAEPIITKWDADSSTYAKVTSLFYENRREARNFIKHVGELQSAMHSLAKENSNSNSHMLVRAQNLMQTAMKRLQKEFYKILSMNRACLDPESLSSRSSLTSTRSSVSLSEYGGDDSEDEIPVAGKLLTDVEIASQIAMADLKLIADCMISTGYGKECIHVYKLMRKSIVDEGIYKLGVENEVSLKKIQKMDWEVLDLKIKNWLDAVKVAVETLFRGERILSDHVFAASRPIVRESCFDEITKDGATILFGFPAIVMKNRKKSPEKIFRTLDMYTAIANHWQAIESIFSSESTSTLLNLALNSAIKLGESVRTALTEFEAAIQKESSKTPAAGAGVHQLTTDVMNFLSFLADYNVLGDIFVDSPTPDKSSLPGSYFELYTDDPQAPPVSRIIAKLILALICKLDLKAEHYKDVSHSYLFLANNIQHIVSKVRTSNLKHLLGQEWMSKHEDKVKLFAANYQRVGWKNVIEAVPANPKELTSPENARESFKRFNAVFEEVRRKQSVCVIPDSKLRDDIKVSIAKELMPLYREFYHAQVIEMRKLERNSSRIVKFAPADVGHALSDLFYGAGTSSVPLSSPRSARSPSSPTPRLSFPRSSSSPPPRLSFP